MLLIDREGIVYVANQIIYDRLGTTKEGIIGKRLYDFFPPDVAETRKKKYNEVFNTGKSISFVDSREGMIFEQNVYPILDDAGQVIMVVIFANDKTDRKKAEEALQEREAFWKMLLNVIPMPVFFKDRDGKYLGSNSAFETFFGKTKEGLIGKTVFDINPPELAEIYCAKDDELFNSGGVQVYESQMKNAHGKLRDIIFNKAAFTDNKGAVTGLIGTIIDITEEKKALQALRESEEKFKLIAENSIDAVWQTDLNNKVTYISSSSINIGGYTPEEIMGLENALDIYDGKTKTLIMNEMVKFMQRPVEELKTLVIPRIEGRGFHKDGHKIWIEIQAKFIFKENMVVGLQGVSRDISERKKAEIALRKNEQLLKAIIESTEDGIFALNQNGEIINANSRFRRMWRIPDELFNRKRGQKILDFIVGQLKEPDDFFSKTQDLYETDKEISDTLYFKDGRIFEWYSRPMRTATKFIGRVWSFRDVTRKVQTETALLESEKQYRTLVDNLPVAVYQNTPGPKGKFLMVNPAFCKILGYNNEEEVKKVSVADIYANPEERKQFSDNLIEKGAIEINERKLVKRDGTPVYASVTASVSNDKDGNVSHFDCILLDISEQKIAEESLRESEEKYRTILESIEDGYYELDIAGNFTFFNDSLCNIFGYSNDELMGMNNRQYTDEENAKELYQTFNTVYTTGKPDKGFAWEIIRKNGTRRSVEASVSLRRDSAGHRAGFRGILRDVTEKKQKEAELINTKNFLQNIFDSSTDGIVTTDLQGKVIYFTPNLKEMSGYNPKELTGKNMSFFYRNGIKETKKIMKELVGKGELTSYETQFQKKDGGLVDVLLSASLLRDEKGEVNGTLGMFKNITEKKALEAQLQRAQKMEAVGTLAGGVAHDLNNILSGLVSYPELLLLQLPEDNPLRDSILTIQKSGEKAAAVVHDLLTLARRGVVTTEVANLNDIISEYLESPEFEKLLSYHSGVHTEKHLEKNVLNILGSPTHLSKTVMNLVSNAVEAMPEGGRLTISTENRYIDRPIRGYDDVAEGDYVVLIITDTGTGISPDDIEKIFEPFYTKKEMGRSGTGLGMAVVWGMVKDHNGYIDVQSIEGKGTTFTLYFPATREKLSTDKSRLAVDSYSGHGESILIVDDVEEQRKIASGMLKELGYSVVSVSSGEEAVEYLKTKKVDLLVLDMIMDPGMDGLDTYKNIIEMNPGQKAIIASGFSETDRVKELQNLGAGRYIRKPFLLEKIGLAVKEELEKQADMRL